MCIYVHVGIHVYIHVCAYVCMFVSMYAEKNHVDRRAGERDVATCRVLTFAKHACAVELFSAINY